MENDARHQPACFQIPTNVIAEISRENGKVHITFPPLPPPVGSNDRREWLERENVLKNRVRLALMANAINRGTHVLMKCIIARKHHASVAGPGSANVRALSQEYGASTIFPNSAVHSIISGLAEGNDGNNEASATKDSTDPRDVILIWGNKRSA